MKGPDEVPGSLKHTFNGGRLIVESVNPGRFSGEMTYKLDPTKDPKAIDLTHTLGKEQGKVRLGIYLLDGDDLKMCVDDERPTEFATRPESGRALIVLKRVTP